MTPLLEVNHLKKHFPLKNQELFSREKPVLKAVDGISLSVNTGETLGLVGESGCGKSTAGRLMLKLLEPTEGEIYFKGQDITSVQGEQLRKLRQDMQIIFQDPYASLNPRKTIEKTIMEPMKIFNVPKSERQKKLDHLLDVVGLSPQHKERYPHEFSGGQRQRIGIARALALDPELVICDEPVSALDVSIQAQVINLMEELQDEFNLTYVFIAHDLSVVYHISDRVAVMYLGELVEIGDVHEVYNNPQHPYTQALLSAVPEANPDHERERILLTGDLPSPANPPTGCKFHTRCPIAQNICHAEAPRYKRVSENGQMAACHFAKEVVAQGT
ncbi:ABC transporter ATP-binding protein [Lentibacillus salicampi]|uniref:Dipeptide ABC transporter ATP-binding protein n=1 Tax=Lentibacillus salicampi TaxID=175306 RepID=A0A4Y9A6P3_9BACI|nr:dipeptide ABC transporter ATP-binding protein [Lentibacillus salicampi]TFJ91348.1 dipeptide ABC transporter ATP-binding protein [Lentibacillus salicampi]